jgi:nucleoid DNA-binding protein
MTKVELAGLVAERMGVSRTLAAKFMDVLGDTIEANITADSRGIPLGKIGVLRPSYYCERIGVNPKTTEKITIPPRHVVKFHSFTSFKQRLNKMKWDDSIFDK